MPTTRSNCNLVFALVCLTKKNSNPIVMTVVRLSNWFAEPTGKPPAQASEKVGIQTLRAGFVFDGRKAERELGIVYTPVHVMLKEEIASLKEHGLE